MGFTHTPEGYLLIFRDARSAPPSRSPSAGYSLGAVSAVALLLFAAVAVVAGDAKTYRVPFRTINGLILLDATVNDNPAKVVLDTGSSATVVSPEMFSLPQLGYDSLGQDPSGVGFVGYAKHMRADLKLADHRFSVAVSVMNLADASKHVGTKIDGILGEDVLRTFRRVRIDFKAGIVEFEN